MRARAVVLATALVMAPLGARGADLVVWWDQGFYPQEDEAIAEVVSAFEQESGNDVELVLQPQENHEVNLVAAVEAGRPPDFAFGIIVSNTSRNGPTRIAWPTSRMSSALFRTCSIRTPSPGSPAQREDRAEGPVCAADWPYDLLRPRLEEPPGAGRFHP
jgi:hypothetical protein